MTMKELFKKVETYNEVADLMNTRKAKIKFYDYDIHSGESFETYDEFRSWVREQFIKEEAEVILKSNSWQFDEELTIEYTDFFGTQTNIFSADLVSA